MREVYQKIYETKDWYGDSTVDRCPGFRFLPLYKGHLLAPVVDLGCGRGDTVRAIRAMGLDAHGFDFIDLKNDMFIADITQPMDLSRFKTSICMDVIEHLTDDQCAGLFKNMQATERQVMSITNAGSCHDNVELHINRKSFEDWETILAKYFTVVHKIEIKKCTMLYLCGGGNVQ